MIAGDQIVDDMANGAEAYLQMWERAERAGAAAEPAVRRARSCRGAAPRAARAAARSSGGRAAPRLSGRGTRTVLLVDAEPRAART